MLLPTEEQFLWYFYIFVSGMHTCIRNGNILPDSCSPVVPISSNPYPPFINKDILFLVRVSGSRISTSISRVSFLYHHTRNVDGSKGRKEFVVVLLEF